jgi:hypothetical protein
MIKVYIIEYKKGETPLIEEVREFKTTLQAEIFINKFNLVTKLRAAKANGAKKPLEWALLASRTVEIGVKSALNVFVPGSVEL